MFYVLHQWRVPGDVKPPVVPATDLHQVLDIRKIGAVLGDQKCSVQGVSRFEGPFNWAVYTLDAHPGWSAFLTPSIAFGILAHKRM
jgi:hypothetical protein